MWELDNLGVTEEECEANWKEIRRQKGAERRGGNAGGRGEKEED